MTRLLLAILGSLLWVQLACAQSATRCAALVGAAGNLTPAGRGWDLSTPGPAALSLTPATSLQCGALGAWIGVQAAPFLRHSYGSLGGRGPLLATWSTGVMVPVGDLGQIGPVYIANRAAWGGGVRWTRRIRLARGFAPRLDLRFDVMAGPNPDVQGWVFIEVMGWDPQASEQGGQVFGAGGRQIRLRQGFEIGTLIGYRLELTSWRRDRRGRLDRPPPDFGVRLGVLHSRRAEQVLQPTALFYVEIPTGDEGTFQPRISAGVTRAHGEQRALWGLGTTLQLEDSPVGLHIGMLIGRDGEVFTALDGGVSFTW